MAWPRGAGVTAAWLLSAACAAPETAPSAVPAPAPAPAPAPRGEADSWDPVFSESIDAAFWTHVYLRLTPTFNGSQLMAAIFPDSVAYVVAVKRGALPWDLVAAGLPPVLAADALAISFNSSDCDSLLLCTREWQVLSWLPIKFWAISPDDKVLVIDTRL